MGWEGGYKESQKGRAGWIHENDSSDQSGQPEGEAMAKFETMSNDPKGSFKKNPRMY